MSESKSKRSGVNRREFVKGAAAAATLYGMPWPAMAEGVPDRSSSSPHPSPTRNRAAC